MALKSVELTQSGSAPPGPPRGGSATDVTPEGDVWWCGRSRLRAGMAPGIPAEAGIHLEMSVRTVDAG
jgi:hypothetical protein